MSYLEFELSVIIVSYNVREELRKCLSGLAGIPDSWEIIVVDNHSGDQSLATLKTQFPQIKTYQNSKNLGFAQAANQGIIESTGEYVLLLNPDTEVASASLRKMVEFLNSSRKVGILGCQIQNPSGDRQYSGRSFPSFSTAFSNNQSFLNRLIPHNPWSRKYMRKDLPLDQPGEVDWVSGSCMLIRREVFWKVGYFDPRFFMFVEDVDFCKRTKGAGWKVVYYPLVTIFHRNGRSVRQKKIKMLAEHHKSMYYYFTKHYDCNKLTELLVFLGIWLRLGTVSLGHWLKT